MHTRTSEFFGSSDACVLYLPKIGGLDLLFSASYTNWLLIDVSMKQSMRFSFDFIDYKMFL